mmetsp:Transcript_6243/g.20812  ORF Transcript_6243/g.20812 Transcript_6243/m.20812 type:complete len:405 (+) Transcript_6243:40-1254(+)
MQRLAAAGFTAAGAVGGAAAAVLFGGASRPSKEEEPPPSPAALARRFCPYGLPSDEHVVVKQGYASSINFRLRIPNWVAEHYSRDQSDADGVDRKHSKFRADESVPADFRATNDDYRGSRLSRGHMAPAGAHKQSQEALDETFLLSANILPQELSNNGSDWLRLERWSRGLLKEYSDVYVVSGPLFLPDDSSAASDAPPPAAASAAAAASASPAVDASAARRRPGPRRRRVAYDVIGPHEVAVPTHLFKVVLAEQTGTGERRLAAFLLPNAPVRGHPDIDEFAVPLADVERASGLTLFEELGAARHSATEVRPLCGAGAAARCGRGAMDGRIAGWKLLGHLKLAGDCSALEEAWGAVPPKTEAFGLMRRTYEDRSGTMACPLAEKRERRGDMTAVCGEDRSGAG